MATTLWGGGGEREIQAHELCMPTHPSPLHVSVQSLAHNKYLYECVCLLTDLYLSLKLFEPFLQQVLAFPGLLVEVNLFG